MKRRYALAAFSFLGLLVLILDTRTALAGGQAAVELCITTVIPSLFPFFVLSNLLTGTFSGSGIPGLGRFEKWFGLPEGNSGIFVVGLLGGYPTGAQAVYQAWTAGTVSKENARWLLAFCSNAGPAFLFGILGQKFPALWMAWLLWGIHILSAAAVAVLFPHAREAGPPFCRNGKPVSLTGAVKRSVAVCGLVCGWIVLFRVMIFFCQRWFLWLLPEAGQVAFYGLLELTGGCCALENVENIGLRFVMASGMVSFGGICVAMQTASVTGALGMASYWLGKITQCVFSMLFAYIAQVLLFPVAQRLVLPIPFLVMLALSAFLSMIIRQKSNKTSSILAISSV